MKLNLDLIVLALGVYFVTEVVSEEKERARRPRPCSKENGSPRFVAHPKFCKYYFQCASGEGDAVIKRCPSRLIWNSERSSCDHAYRAVNPECGHKPDAGHIEGYSSATRKRAGAKCEIQCPGTQMCILSHQICNGHADCPEGWDETKCAKECDKRKCKLPSCHCASIYPPHNMQPSEVPQIVTISFDSAVRMDDISGMVRKIFGNRKNPNGCAMRGTFFVTHQWTDYAAVQFLHSVGHEIAALSISQRTPNDFWKTASKDQWKEEMADQRIIMKHFTNISADEMIGLRAPFFQVGGNAQFEMMVENGFKYDSSLVTDRSNPPLFPYTLDYNPNVTCLQQPCPTASFPGLWEIPPVNLVSLDKARCVQVDECKTPEDKRSTFLFLLSNFNRHYKTNRAPFQLVFRKRWFTHRPYIKEAVQDFMDHLASMDDVWVVTAQQLVTWMQYPMPSRVMTRYLPFMCQNNRGRRSRLCRKKSVCVYDDVDIPPTRGKRYIRSCQRSCPAKYPYVGNPEGLKNKGYSIEGY